MLRITVLALGVVFFLTVFKLLISGKMTERASLSWIACSLIVIVLSIFPYSIDTVAKMVNIDYPPTLIFLVSILIIFVLLLYQSIHISILQYKITELAQTISIINSVGVSNKIEDRRKKLEDRRQRIEEISTEDRRKRTEDRRGQRTE